MFVYFGVLLNVCKYCTENNMYNLYTTCSVYTIATAASGKSGQFSNIN